MFPTTLNDQSLIGFWTLSETTMEAPKTEPKQRLEDFLNLPGRVCAPLPGISRFLTEARCFLPIASPSKALVEKLSGFISSPVLDFVKGLMSK